MAGVGVVGVLTSIAGIGISLTPAAPLGWMMIGGGAGLAAVGGFASWWEDHVASGETAPARSPTNHHYHWLLSSPGMWSCCGVLV